MNSARKTDLILAISLVVLLSAICPHDLAKILTPASAQAQEPSKSSRLSLGLQSSDSDDQGDQDRPRGKTSISVAVDLVSLQVLVTDKNGNVITGLKPENFTIYEDNVKQEITNFAPIEANLTVVVLVEYSRIVANLLDEIWNAMYAFVNTLRPDDWVALVGYDSRPTILCDFSRNRRKFEEALRVLNYPALSDSNLCDAVIDTLDRTQEIEGKVAVVLISTGLDTFSKHTYDEALKKCKEANASIYAIGLGQSARLYNEAFGGISPEVNIELLMADNRLKSFAEFTGGQAYFPRFVSEYHSIFSNISGLLRSQYSIAYASSNTKKDGKFRKIRVEVKSNLMEKGKPVKLKAITRKGYIAGQP